MANVYADLGTWSGITPYVGAGIGYGMTNITGLTDQGTALGGPGRRLSSAMARKAASPGR